MKKFFYISLALTLALFSGCKKKADVPPVRNLGDGTFYNAGQLRSIASCTDGCNNRFTDEAYFKGVVIADELTGNFYKEIYVRDAANTGGVHMTFTVSGSNLFIGDSVRLNLKGYDVNLNSGMVEIDSVNFEKNVVKFATGANPQPRVIDFAVNSYTNYLCDLVTINNVQFSPADTGFNGSIPPIYADAIKQTSLNHTLSDPFGNNIVVRTSNYALFAGQRIPKGFGTIIGLATAFGSTNQLMIRTPNEVNMNGGRFFIKDFADGSITSGGWTQYSVINSAVTWSASTFSGTYFAKISGFIGGNQNSENWLISPAYNLSASTNPILNFRTGAKFSGPPLEVWVSTNYVSGAPSTATWTQLTGFALGAITPGYVFTPSGDISLSGFKSPNTRIAFKYTSTTSGATTYEVANISVRTN